jgi:Raf kinase inhibitor-like YbhB/YbcL family protein
MTITSSAFKEGGSIPSRYTCDGSDISPPLAWSQVPDGTRSLALICDDPDAPGGTWVHWVLYDLPAGASGLPEGVTTGADSGTAGTQGINDFRRSGYGGPCPPGGSHRYFFRLYALSKELALAPGATKRDLLGAMKGAVLTEAALMGRYRRA